MKKPNQIVDDTTTITVPVIDFVVIEERLLVSMNFFMHPLYPPRSTPPRATPFLTISETLIHRELENRILI